MESVVDLQKGQDAFPACPACGGERIYYNPETEDDYAFWEFACGCGLILNGDGLIEAYTNCPHAMDAIIEGLVLLAKQEES